jgi:hypothetical protein
MFFLINFSARRSENQKKSGPRQKILIFKQEVVMKNKIILLTAMFLIGSFLTAQTSFSQPGSFLEQETYLFQKEEVENAPWNIILQIDNEQVTNPYAKFEYFNYPVLNDEDVYSFYFDLKGYNIPFDNVEEYALIYFVDPAQEYWPATVYVFGTADSEWTSPANGRGPQGSGPPGHEGVNLKIDGLCPTSSIPNIPISFEQFKGLADDLDPTYEDVNYPNGGKIWLVPTEYLTDTEPCTWQQMTGWPTDVSEILFESSLITFGYVNIENGQNEEEVE